MTHACANCGKHFERRLNYNYHLQICEFHRTGVRPVQSQWGGEIRTESEESDELIFTLADEALEGTVTRYELNLRRQEQNVENIYELLKQSFYLSRPVIVGELEKKKSIKISYSLSVEFHQAVDESFITVPPLVLNTLPREVLEDVDLEEMIALFYQDILDKIDTSEKDGSGWVLHQLIRLDLHIYHFDPLRASAYLRLPKWIYSKRAVVNVKNDDAYCFVWAVLACLYSDQVQRDRERVMYYVPYFSEINLHGIQMPMRVCDIVKFERNNNISISVYGVEEEFDPSVNGLTGYLYPIKVAKDVREKHVDLLMYSAGEKSHFCWIRNISRLIGGQYSSHGHELAYCRFCLHGFVGKVVKGKHTRLEDAKRRRDDHEKECYVHNGQNLVFPDFDYVEFCNIEKQVPAPFRIYADFETCLEDIKNVKREESLNDISMYDEEKEETRTSYTEHYQHHNACSFAYLIVSTIPELNFEPKLYFG